MDARKPRYRLRRLSASVQEVTPEQAAAWLSNNPRNRPLMENRVAAYTSAMRSGGWAEKSRDPIEVLDTGRLLNRQHRLTAVIRAGIPVRMRVVVYGKELVGGS